MVETEQRRPSGDQGGASDQLGGGSGRDYISWVPPEMSLVRIALMLERLAVAQERAAVALERVAQGLPWAGRGTE